MMFIMALSRAGKPEEIQTEGSVLQTLRNREGLSEGSVSAVWEKNPDVDTGEM